MTGLLGFAIALVIGLTGMGGGVLAAPILLLFLGVPAHVAVGTSLVFVAVAKLFAAPLFVFRGQVHYRILGMMLLGGLPGAVLGAQVLKRLSSSGLNGLVLVILGLIVAGSALVSLFRGGAREAAHGAADKARRLPWASFPIGLEVGFSSAGAGALGALMLLHWTVIPAAQVVGTDLLFGLVLAAAGGAVHFTHGNLDWRILEPLLAGGIPGAMLGSWLATVLPSRALKKGLSLWLVWLGAQLCYRGAGVLGQ